MKKIVFYLFVMLIACTCTAKSIYDTVYPPAHLDDYILPYALRNDGGCLYSIADTVHTGLCFPIDVTFWRGKYILAVPYYSDTLVSIYGIGVLGSKLDTNLSDPRFQIRDSLPNNILRSKTASFQGNNTPCNNVYTEVFFDTPITIQGLYHVSVEVGEYSGIYTWNIAILNYIYHFNEIPPQQERCGKCNSDYAPLYKDRGDTAWHAYPHATAADPWVYGIDAYYSIPLMFPIKGELVLPSDTTITDTTSSALSANLLNEESVRVYPNPASEVLNVASDYNILNVAIFDAMNRLVEEKEVNAKNIRISLAQRSAGVYFIKVRTDRGSTMRKFVIK